MDATPSVRLPADASASGIPERPPRPITLRGAAFAWGTRTFVMGILNVTPDSFSGDGLITVGGSDAALARAMEQARTMAADGADLLDVGGESTRPGHPAVDEAEELRRVIPVIQALRDALPAMPVSIDTIKPGVARAALEAGADFINDVWGTGPSDALARVAAERDVPYVISQVPAHQLFDPTAWATRARLLERRLDESTVKLDADHGDRIADAFVIGAAALAHVRSDPLLPVELCGPDWPGAALRRTYRDYQVTFAATARQWFQQR